MNRLDFFKWIGRGAAAVAVAPLVKYLPKTSITTGMTTEEWAAMIEPTFQRVLASGPFDGCAMKGDEE